MHTVLMISMVTWLSAQTPDAPAPAPAPAEVVTTAPAVPAPAVPAPAVPAPAVPAPAVPAPAVPAPAVPASAATTTPLPPKIPIAAPVIEPPPRRLGDPIPVAQRSLTLAPGMMMVGARYGLVGTPPTRLVDDIRVGITDWLELRTALLPYPAALMARARFLDPNDDFGAIIIEGGLAYFDAGLRLVQDTNEPKVGFRFHLEGVLSWHKNFSDQILVQVLAHYRQRLSLLPDDDQRAMAASAHISYDLLPSLSVRGGVGFATMLGTPVREVGVTFTETDMPGMSHLIARDEGGSMSVTLPVSITYGRTDTFDVDVFCTPRVFPEFGILLGAGLRWRFEPLTWFN